MINNKKNNRQTKINNIGIFDRIIGLFFIFLFIGAVYGQNSVIEDFREENLNLEGVDSEVVACNTYLANSDVSEVNYVFNRNDGCYTVELPKASVNQIWNKILTKGFKIDVVDSDQTAIPKDQREGMVKSDVLLTNSGSKSGDQVIKQEMPSKVINPLETPTILGQMCNGSFQYGVDLDSTLRVGRCVDPDNCYTQMDGLFRSNSSTGFFQSTEVVFKDALDAIGVNKIKEVSGELISGEKQENTVDLGVFSDMSLEEINEYKQMLSKGDSEQINLEQVEFLKDKMIQNSYTTNSFAVDMQTTCRGENCYINMYSLFDKMFNQYFSVDMVLSSSAPIIMNTASKVFLNNKVAQQAFEFLPNSLKKTKIIKEGGFWDNLLDDPVNLFKNPSSQFNKSLQVSRNKYNVGKVIDNINSQSLFRNSVSLADTQRNLQHYGIWDDYIDLIGKAQNKKEIGGFVSEKILKNSNYTPAQKRAFVDAVTQQAQNAQILKSFSDARMSDDLVTGAIKKIDDALAAGKTLPRDWVSELTVDEYDALFNAAGDLTRLGKEYQKTTFGKFDWKDGFSDFDVVQNRVLRDNTTIDLTSGTYAGNTVELSDIKLNQVTVGSSVGELPADAFQFDVVDGVYVPKDASKLRIATENVTQNLADGRIDVSKIKVKGNMPSTTLDSIDTFSKDIIKDWVDGYPSDFLRYVDDTGSHILPMSRFTDPSKIDDLASISGINFELVKGDLIDLPVEEFGIDPIELAYSSLKEQKNIVKRYGDYAGGMDQTVKALENSEWITPRGTNFINQKMKALANPSYTARFLTRPHKSLGWNFAYWQVRSGFANIGGGVLGLDKYSMFRLPKTYSALHITHDLTPQIYDDAYIDYFANEGSDQGDLFMNFINSAVFFFPYVGKQILENVDGKFFESLDSSLDDMLKGKIKRNEVDNIALFSDTINTGCSSGLCKFVISNTDYIEKETYDKSTNIDEEEIKKSYLGNITDDYINNKKEEATQYYTEQKIQDKYLEMDQSLESIKEQMIANDIEEEKVEELIAKYRVQYKANIDSMHPTIENKVSNKVNNIRDELNISFLVPGSVSVENYVLENTTLKNLEDKGQNLITFSHHTNYSSTMQDQSSTETINLQESLSKGETCEDKLRNLELLGMPIGMVTPKDYRAAGTMVLAEHAAYVLMPAYFNPWLLAAAVTTIPQQTLIMPEIYGCVDDKEGYYSHFFVSNEETERIEEDSKNKVGNMVESGVNTIEESLVNITKDTEFEKTVKTGTSSAKEFIEENLKDYDIVQSRFSTSGDTSANVNGLLYHFELGPGTSCRANSLVDQGVEILKDDDTGLSLEVNKEKGEMNIINEDGSIDEIISSENSDFVRLTSTNLNIPAKVIPHSLSYIPVPDTNSALFEIDAAGNLFVLDSSFLGCLKSGYEAQTGERIPEGLIHLEEYLGKVKSVNVLNSLGEYNVYPQNTRIVAEGNPRQIADGTLSKIKIDGTRKTILSKVNNEDSTIGKNISIQFENGQLLYSGEENSYIMWIEHTSITNSNDIKDISTSVVRSESENGCDDEELAIDFKAIARDEDETSQGYNNVKKLNNALENVGPFKMFDTAKRTFIFYLSEPPECEQRLKIIDKETGEILDEIITDIQETPNGIKVKTADGSEHDFEFSADNGVPQVKYNGDNETLLSAQGENGSFWFDPQTGNWYTENGHLIPFDDQFKDGMMFGVNDDGKVTGTPGQNIFNIGQDAGSNQGNSPFNIPLTPTKELYNILYLMFIISLFSIIYIFYTKKEK